MQFINYDLLPHAIKERIDARDFNGYVRVCHRGIRYSLDTFFRDTTSGKIEEYKKGNKEISCYAEEIEKEIKTVYEELFEKNNQAGPQELYEYCKANEFYEKESIYLGFCETEHFVFLIDVEKENDCAANCICRVYFYEKNL